MQFTDYKHQHLQYTVKKHINTITTTYTYHILESYKQHILIFLHDTYPSSANIELKLFPNPNKNWNRQLIHILNSLILFLVISCCTVLEKYSCVVILLELETIGFS